MSSDHRDKQFMKLAMDEARKGLGFTSPNPAVGAVVVKDGQVVGKGYHKRAGSNHAEVNAIEDAGVLCEGATIYVTLEPCNHTGRTPPCTLAILNAKINRVVIGALDPNPAVEGGGADFLRSKGLDVEVGCLESECKYLLAPFAKYSRTGMPWIRVKTASSLDGRIATRTGDSKWITNELARNHGQLLRRYSDAILVGRNTAMTDNPNLTYRGEDSEKKRLVRIILDTGLACPLNLRLFETSPQSPTILVCGSQADKDGEKRKRFEAKGVTVLEMPLDETERIDLHGLLKALGRMEIQSILVEGGATVHGSFWDAGLVDEAFFFFAPIVIGGDAAPVSILGRGGEKISEATRLINVEMRKFDDNYLITGLVTDIESFWR